MGDTISIVMAAPIPRRMVAGVTDDFLYCVAACHALNKAHVLMNKHL